MQMTNALIAASIVLLTGSMAANIAFMRQDAILRAKVTSLSSELKITLNVPLQAPMSGTSLSGSPLAIDFRRADSTTGRHQAKILFVLSPECRFCAANWTNWHQLLKDRGGDARWEPVIVNTGPPLDADYLRRHEIGTFAVLQSVSPQSAVNYKLFSTPRTIVIDAEGRARGAWEGILRPDEMAAVRKLISDPAVVGGAPAKDTEVKNDKVRNWANKGVVIP